MIINPGSKIAGSTGEGWSNTVEVARERAANWLRMMHMEGMTEVTLLPGEEEYEARWRFRFRHAVTGVVVELEEHGIDDLDAYEKQHIFTPRTYWRGSSCSNPKIEDFAAPGFRMHQTFVPDEEGKR